ncbi:MAG: choice-of-anchor tandem repeat GloVer-containing protein [Candidatus Sulfotelmatobacter sp.]
MTVLHTFTGGADGGTPQGTLLFDKAGNLYGTTWEGGQYGFGVAFELTPHANGKWGEKVLHAFKSGGDGANPFGGLISDTAGNLYGTTSVGGNNQCGGSSLPIGCGIVYELTPNSNGSTTEKVLVRFHGTPSATPYNDLLMDSLGNLYGTTTGYGAENAGSVYEVVR